MREFNTSVEATVELHGLIQRKNKLPYNPDINKLIANIEQMINELSIKEVYARQQHKSKIVDAKRQEIKQAMDYLDKLLLMQQLMQ